MRKIQYKECNIDSQEVFIKKGGTSIVGHRFKFTVMIQKLCGEITREVQTHHVEIGLKWH